VESEEGVGTTFLFLLPDPRPESREPSPASSGNSL
jgi:hypothetical protein